MTSLNRLSRMGCWFPRDLLERVFAIPPTFGSRDVLQVRDAAMPHRINTIHLEQGFQILQFLIGHKGHGNARPTHSPGPSRSVCIAFQTRRIVIIDHMTDMVEVESTTGNVRGNHEGNLLSAKTLEDRCSLRLLQTPVDIADRAEFPFQLLDQFLTVMPRIAEDDGLGDLLPCSGIQSGY